MDSVPLVDYSGSDSGSEPGTSRPPQFPYPGDGYDPVAWRAYDLSFCAIYAALTIAAAFLTYRIVRHLRLDGAIRKQSSIRWLRLIFYITVCFQTLMRSVYFLMVSFWRAVEPGDPRLVALSVLVLLSDGLFLSSYTVLLTYWALLDFATSNTAHRRRLLLRACIVVNVAFYFMLVLLGALVGTHALERGQIANVAVLAIAIFSAVVALAYCVFGVRMVYKLRALPLQRRRSISAQILILSGVCSLCFIYRMIFVLTVPNRAYGNIAALASYLIAGEIIPLLVLIGVFHFLPRWRRFSNSDVVNSPPLSPAPKAASEALLVGPNNEEDWLNDLEDELDFDQSNLPDGAQSAAASDALLLMRKGQPTSAYGAA